MQLDFLQGDVETAKENRAASPKKAKRPQRNYPVIEVKKTEVEQALPPLPESLRAPFVDPETIEDDVEKAPGAFKTISETAKFLGVPQHVLRFWESRFSQIRPLKLNGGRRYYRPQDIDILTTIKNLLYKQGYTIKGAKKAFLAEKQHAKIPVDAPPAHPAHDDTQSKMQLATIRQELISLRDSLRSHISK